MSRCFEGDDDRRAWFREQRALFDKMVDKPLDEKVDFSMGVVRSAHEMHGDKMVVASSFGKDSTVLVHMAILVNPQIRVIFNNTGVEFPESLDQRDRLVKEWDLNYIELKPPRTFFDIVREYGLPHHTRYKKRAPKCCQILKERPMRDYIREHDVEATLVGILGTESYQRRFHALKDGVETSLVALGAEDAHQGRLDEGNQI